MNPIFIHYPKCSTCQKAAKWLKGKNISTINRHIVEENPTFSELKEWIGRSGLPIKKFFNTSGNLYKELNLKDKISTSTDDELIEMLASNGMLVKRPLLISEDFVITGFKEEDWEKRLA